MSRFLTDLQAELALFGQGGELGVLLCALAAGVLMSVACGVIGSYVVVRRISYIAGGIAHCVLGGMGAAVYCNKALGWSWVDPIWGRQWLTPMTGAVVAALLAAALIGAVSMRFKQREDTVIGAMWAVGMAAGVLFMWATPGYQQDLMSYLFGDILMVAGEHLVLMAVLDVVVVAVSLLLYKQFLAVCFDEEFARTRGLRTDVYYMLLLCLAAVTVVLLAAVVGVVMVIALLTLPAATAGQFTRRLWCMMVLAGVLCAAATTAGLAVSYGPGLSSGATIIVLSAGMFLAVVAVKALFRVLRPRRQ